MFTICRQSRRNLRRYFVTGPRASQVEKVFSLLVESGMIYCALWVSIKSPHIPTQDEVANWKHIDCGPRLAGRDLRLEDHMDSG